jgi:hypothetical protein
VVVQGALNWHGGTHAHFAGERCQSAALAVDDGPGNRLERLSHIVHQSFIDR